MATITRTHIELRTGEPLKVGQVFTRKGSSAIFRVIGEGNYVERFDGNRKERARQLAAWKALVPQRATRTVQDHPDRWPSAFSPLAD